MATSTGTDMSVEVYRDQLAEQPTWMQSANTWVSLGVGVALQIVTILIDSAAPLPEEVVRYLPVVAAILTSAAIKLTPNGRTPRGLVALQAGTSQYIDDHRGCGDISPQASTQSPETVVSVPPDPTRE